MRAIPWLLAAVLIGGCAASQPKKRLADAVHTMNDAARWGRIGTAVEMVEPTYRMRFMEAHRGWGDEVQVADSEVMQVDYAPDGAAAVAVINYSWYNLRTMTLHSTMVRQQWTQRDDQFTLASEQVIKGDGALFAEAAPEG